MFLVVLSDVASKMHGGYKTALCKNFMQHGSCAYDRQCNYAHGPMELRSSPTAGLPPSMYSSMHHSMPPRNNLGSSHPKYKTSLCASVINGTECTNGMLYLLL